MRINLAQRIDPRDLADYLARRLSSRDIARMYSTKPVYVTKVLPKRPKPSTEAERRQLVQARKEYRMMLATQVAQNSLDVEVASNNARCSVRTMYRYVAKAKKLLGMPDA